MGRVHYMNNHRNILKQFQRLIFYRMLWEWFLQDKLPQVFLTIFGQLVLLKLGTVVLKGQNHRELWRHKRCVTDSYDDILSQVGGERWRRYEEWFICTNILDSERRAILMCRLHNPLPNERSGNHAYFLCILIKHTKQSCFSLKISRHCVAELFSRSDFL